MNAAPVGIADRRLRILMMSTFERATISIKVIAADIARELREHPERWTQGTPARDKEGDSTRARSPAAVSWCLFGHIRRRLYPARCAVGTSSLLFGRLASSWNDAPERTVTDVIALCEKVASCADPGDAPDCSFDFAPAQYDRELAA